MKANPGGQIDLKEVVGRTQLIENMWDTLEQQSIRMVAERRIGKTTIIKKLRSEPREGWLTIFQDLEQYHTAVEFSVAIYKEVAQRLPESKKLLGRTAALLKSLGGVEVAGIIKFPASTKALPWKDILNTAIQDLIHAQAESAQKVLFLWDEMPFMLANIKERESEKVAMEVLDLLRSLRQTHGENGLRMVITGSIGLHHVISALKKENYANSPVNDTLLFEVLPLTLEYAVELAIKLIEGEAIPCDSITPCAEVIAEISDQFPFYIHHIVKALKLSGERGSPESVVKIVQKQLLDANDPWELNHYRERIPGYYGKEHENVVLAILDSLAESEQPVSLKALITDLKSSGIDETREVINELLRLIRQDHYLSRNDEGHYLFQFPLLQKWWKLYRGL